MKTKNPTRSRVQTENPTATSWLRFIGVVHYDPTFLTLSFKQVSLMCPDWKHNYNVLTTFHRRRTLWCHLFVNFVFQYVSISHVLRLDPNHNVFTTFYMRRKLLYHFFTFSFQQVFVTCSDWKPNDNVLTTFNRRRTLWYRLKISSHARIENPTTTSWPHWAYYTIIDLCWGGLGVLLNSKRHIDRRGGEFNMIKFTVH